MMSANEARTAASKSKSKVKEEAAERKRQDEINKRNLLKCIKGDVNLCLERISEQVAEASKNGESECIWQKSRHDPSLGYWYLNKLAGLLKDRLEKKGYKVISGVTEVSSPIYDGSIDYCQIDSEYVENRLAIIVKW